MVILVLGTGGRADLADPSAGVGGDPERLGEIVAEHGWPTRSLVGDDGATAA